MPSLALLIKPASGACNLRCKYCFYADEMQKRSIPSFGVMSVETLSVVLQKAFAYADGPVSIAFQGGEPTLVGLEFFRQAVRLTEEYNTRNIPVHFSLQTNGIALNEEWAVFLAQQHFLVGISLDGTQPIHDKNRVFPDGAGSFSTVMDRIALLRRFGVDFNILTVVTRQTAGNIGKIYRFFQEQGLGYQQFIPCLDPLWETHGQQDYSLTANKYESFLKQLFDAWYRDLSQGRNVYNRYFDNLVGMLLLQPPESCGMLGHCTVQNVVEADGSVYPCDFYVLDEYRLGDLHTDSFADIDRRRKELGFIEDSMAVHPDCRVCKWFPICRGGCRRDRQQPDGTLGKNRFCSAYQGFFSYAMPRLEALAQALRRGN